MLPKDHYTTETLRRKNREAQRKSRAAKKANRPPKAELGDYALTEAEAAYIAGFFDGEGMVTITRQYSKGARGKRVNPSYTMLIKISQSELPVLEWIKSKCGGCITSYVPKKGRRHWNLVKKSNGAALLLSKLFPYLIVKREQAVHALEFQRLQGIHKNRYEAGRSGPVPRTPEEIAYKEHYLNLLQALKKPAYLL